jgi:putative membrane protein insertion efficiency factor
MKRLLISILHFYKKAISPLLPNACKYTPTCSEYAMEAIEKHGVLKGSVLAIWRILRCNPFSRGGYDPVPEPHNYKGVHKK